MSASTFQRCAIASGLVTQDEMERALMSLRALASASNRDIDDDQLASQLIAMGRLNSWQAAQLSAGRSAFTLGPYHIVDSLGKGRTGDVFMAEHAVMGRIVAIKVLPKRNSTPAAVAKFTAEIRTQARLEHKNLVRAFDAGHERGVHFLVMEYVPGANLRNRVRRQGKLNMATAADLISQAADGLAYAHREGLPHGAVKPSNILITSEGQVKLSDLGLASFFDDATPLKKESSSLARTADFLAPEQINDPGSVSPSADLYALGCTLYYAVTGKTPFPGRTLAEKFAGHLHALPRHPRLLNAELSDVFVDLIADMMAKDPQERIATVEEAARRLREIAGIGSP